MTADDHERRGLAKIGAELAAAVHRDDGAKAIAICDRLRSVGFTYPRIVALMQGAAPGLDEGELDACIREGEAGGA